MQRFRVHFIIAVVVTVVALSVFHSFAQEQNPRQLFERARMLDESNQNLTEAIKLYSQVVKQSQEQRALAARAQLRVGLLYERLGRKAEAQRAFQAVVSQYADQAEVARQAQAKLPKGANAAANMNSKVATGLTVRKVLDASVSLNDAVSPDGRYVVGLDWEAGGIAIRDLLTGEKRRLTNKLGKDAWYDTPIFSADGKQIAYTVGISQGKNDTYELHIVGADGSGERLIYRNDSLWWLGSYDWSPDGKQLLAYLQNEVNQSKNESMVLISVADGATRILKSLSYEKNPGGFGVSRFSPDGRYIAYEYHPRNGVNEYDIAVIASDGSRDVPLVQAPADDRLLGWTPDGKSILFASDRAKTMDAWLLPVAEGKSQGVPELVKRDLGRVWPMGITRSGAFYYSLNIPGVRDIYSVTLAAETGKVTGAPTPVSTSFMGVNVAADLSRDGRNLVYLSNWQMREGYYAPPTLSTLALETGEVREVKTSLVRFGNPRWFPDGRHILANGASPTSDGSRDGLYKIDAQTGEAVKLLPEEKGVLKTAYLFSPDGKAVFYQTKNVLYRHDLATSEAKEIYRSPRPGSSTFTYPQPPPTPRETDYFTGSLAFSPDSQQLAFTFERSLFVMPATGGEPRELLTLKSPELFAVVYAIAWTPDGRYLLFAKYQEKQSELWRIPAAGGTPEKLGTLPEGFRNLCIHPDGRRIIFSAGSDTTLRKREVWVMENFLQAAQPAKTSTSRR